MEKDEESGAMTGPEERAGGTPMVNHAFFRALGYNGAWTKERTMRGLSLNAIGQIGRIVADIEASIAWYRDILGLPLLYRFEGMAFFDAGGTRLYLQQAARPEPVSILYFGVDDIEATHERLVACGVTFMRTPHLVHRHDNGLEEWMAFLADPEGRPLALMAQRQI